MKKELRETQTLRAGCSKAKPNFFDPPQTPLSGGVGRPKFNHLEMVWRWSLPQFVEDRCTQFRVIMVIDAPTHKQTDRTDYTMHCAAASAQCKYRQTPCVAVCIWQRWNGSGSDRPKYNMAHINIQKHSRERLRRCLLRIIAPQQARVTGVRTSALWGFDWQSTLPRKH